MIKIEIADTYKSREIGLMFRKSMPDNNGMLFKFDKPQVLSFWMANTYIPLDIAFLDSDMRVVKIANMAPLSTKSVSSELACPYALEVPVGTFDRHDIGVGTKLKVENNSIFIEK